MKYLTLITLILLSSACYSSDGPDPEHELVICKTRSYNYVLHAATHKTGEIVNRINSKYNEMWHYSPGRYACKKVPCSIRLEAMPNYNEKDLEMYFKFVGHYMDKCEN